MAPLPVADDYDAVKDRHLQGNPLGPRLTIEGFSVCEADEEGLGIAVVVGAADRTHAVQNTAVLFVIAQLNRNVLRFWIGIIDHADSGSRLVAAISRAGTTK